MVFKRNFNQTTSGCCRYDGDIYRGTFQSSSSICQNGNGAAYGIGGWKTILDKLTETESNGEVRVG